MTPLYDRLIQQLDSLVPFLALEHEAFFQVLQNNFRNWFPKSSEDNSTATLTSYKSQIAHGAFLLGYSYFEAYLFDLLKEVFKKHPEILPDNKTLGFKEILSRNAYDDILDLMIQKELGGLSRNSLKEIGNYLQQNKLKLHQGDFDKIVIEGSLIRNCLVHNNSLADGKLAATSKYTIGDLIILTIGDINDFGVVARQLANKIDTEAMKRHLTRN
jgi:hypothetical protein